MVNFSSAIQARHYSLFKHTVLLDLDDNTDTKKILAVFPVEDGRDHPDALGLTEVVSMAQNQPLRRLLAASGTTHSQWRRPEMTIHQTRKARKWPLKLPLCADYYYYSY